MGEAIIISVLCILSIFGVHKIFEMILSLRKTADKRKMLLLYKMTGEQNPELVVRSLAEQNDLNVFVLCGEQEGEGYAVCLKTAAQYRNVVVGTVRDLVETLKT